MSDDSNDGEVLLSLLCSADDDEAFLQIFREIQGPYAFLYYQVDITHHINQYVSPFFIYGSPSAIDQMLAQDHFRGTAS